MAKTSDKIPPGLFSDRLPPVPERKLTDFDTFWNTHSGRIEQRRFSFDMTAIFRLWPVFSTSAAALAVAVFLALPMVAGTGSRLMVAGAEGQVRIGGRDLQTTGIRALNRGAQVSTGKGARLTVQLHKRMDIVIQESTEVQMINVPRSGRLEFHMRMAAGRAAFHPRQLKQGESCVIETADVLVKVTGTVFTVAIDDNGHTSVAVTEGSVELRPADDPGLQPVVLQAGQAADAGRNPVDGKLKMAVRPVNSQETALLAETLQIRQDADPRPELLIISAPDGSELKVNGEAYAQPLAIRRPSDGRLEIELKTVQDLFRTNLILRKGQRNIKLEPSLMEKIETGWQMNTGFAASSLTIAAASGQPLLKSAQGLVLVSADGGRKTFFSNTAGAGNVFMDDRGVAVVTEKGGVTLYDLEGHTVWSDSRPGRCLYSAGAAMNSRYVAVTTSENGVFIYSRDGQYLGMIATNEAFYISSVLGQNGDTAVLASENGRVSAYQLNTLEPLWSLELPGRAVFPLLTDGGTVYLFLRESAVLAAIDSRTGKIRWQTRVGGFEKTITAPVLVGNRIILAHETRLAEISCTDGQVQLRKAEAAIVEMESAGGNLYLLLADGRVLLQNQAGRMSMVADTADEIQSGAGRIYIRNGSSLICLP